MTKNDEHVLATADIRYAKTKKHKIFTLVYLAVISLSLIIGMISGTWTYHSDGGKTIYGDSYPAHDDLYIGWFGVDFYENSEGWETINFGYGIERTFWDDNIETFWGNIIVVLFAYVILFALPGVINKVFTKQCAITELTVTDSQVYGSYNHFLSKKSLQMPIEKVDNLTTGNGLFDKMRTGVTLGVCSASGIIKLHFVQNADEVITAAMGRIDELKEKEKRARVVTQSATGASAATVSVTDKLKDLQAMKENGLISEEEFAKKREELISNL